MDIFFDYSNSVYSMFKMHSSLVIVDFGLYLTIWIRLYKSLEVKAQKVLTALEAISSLLLAVFSILFVLESVSNFTYVGKKPFISDFIDIFSMVLKIYFMICQLILIIKTSYSLTALRTELYTYSHFETKCVAFTYFFSLAIWLAIDILKMSVE